MVMAMVAHAVLIGIHKIIAYAIPVPIIIAMVVANPVPVLIQEAMIPANPVPIGIHKAFSQITSANTADPVPIPMMCLCRQSRRNCQQTHQGCRNPFLHYNIPSFPPK